MLSWVYVGWEFMNLKKIFESPSYLVVNKPSGMVVNKVPEHRGETIQDWMEAKFDFKKFKHAEFLKRGGVVHRLDKETSGVLVLAKNPKAFLNLKSQFKKRQVKKTYWGLAHGVVSPQEGNINLPLKRRRDDRRLYGVDISGRPALTFYKVRSSWGRAHQGYSLAEVWPKTGRTHQIRVHFQHLGNTLVSDPLYLSESQLESDRQWCSRLFLHAKKIIFTSPDTDKPVEYMAKLPDELEKVLKGLE